MFETDWSATLTLFHVCVRCALPTTAIGKRHSHKKRPTEKFFRRNEWIKAPQVKLIDEDEGFIGIVDTNVALAKAREKGLDLIEISPKETPPVAKIIDYGKFKYELEKKKQKQKLKKTETKGIRLTLNMGTHDLETKLKQTEKFLEFGHKAQVEMVMRGRELAHVKRGFEQIEAFIKNLAGAASVIQSPSRKGNRIIVLLTPNATKTQQKN